MRQAKKLFSALLALMVFGFTAAAQDFLEDPRYGSTPEERQETVIKLQFFKTAFETNDYDNAAALLHEIIGVAPSASINMYVRGTNLYKAKIERATSVPEKNALVDTLMYLFDLRAEYFGDDPEEPRGEILAKKAFQYADYRPLDRDNIRRLFHEAVEASEGNDPVIVDSYFSYLVEDYQEDLVETDELLGEYERLYALLDRNKTEENIEGQKILEGLLLTSGAADCDNLEKLFKPQYEADPNNVELMQRILGRMSRQNCGSDFQLEVAENLYKIEPTPETSLMLAAVFEGKNDYEKSLYYWEEAIKNETDPEKKANFIIRAASSALASNNTSRAASFARQAIAIQSDNGVAYYIYAQALAQNTGSCADFERQAAYWIVVDNLQRARNLLGAGHELTDNINRQIANYSAAFPQDTELFFRGLNEGNSYTVNCGLVSGTTTVRARK